ncbi:ABC transporter permease [Halobacillus naozhouensis]|uniref:Transport permease protein n=1 Tax=Halobacillus naozhouensis TaxID=554880 RepID=A0ABY8IUM1_9BACI|nr:ABC transporter permease [Halobacillus naozhouensis]WFT73802.1 ABC transporter permease [Halobacillus naozhouensis]
MKSVIHVIKEQLENIYLIRRLSLYELKSKNNNNYLGMAWEVINPLIQILIYWFVFGVGIRETGNMNVNGQQVPFIFWLMAGIVLWFYFYQATIQGSKSIYSRLKMLSKMNFPMSVIPSYIIFSQFYIHLLMLIIVIIIFQLSGYPINVYYLQFVYLIFATFTLIFAISLITSTLSTIVRDVHMFLNSTLKMFLYLSPILWEISTLEEPLPTIMKLNPLYYLIEGYRAALFGVEWYFIEHWQYTLYFWGLTIVFLVFGAVLHIKFRRHFIDYL